MQHEAGGTGSLKPLCVELCAGTAGLSLALRKLGFSVCAVDYAQNRHAAKVPILVADLATESGQRTVDAVLGSPALFFCHCAPPCGAASRARERHIPAPQLHGLPLPRPLRDATFPEGIPGLPPGDQARVDKANAVYAYVARVAERLHRRGKLVLIENPLTSLMWATSFFRPLFRAGFRLLELHHCMVGSGRKKRTGLLCNHDTF